MATLRPFAAYRPVSHLAGEVASKPYDVLTSAEAREEVRGHPLSFLHVGKPEIDLPPDIDPYDPRVYRQGRQNLMHLIDQKVLVRDQQPCLYVYAQTMAGRTQYGLVGCASVEEYWNDVIKKHEHTRKDKEEDRSNHVRVTNAHTGPIFLTYRDSERIDEIVRRVVSGTPENDHTAPDGIRHRCWVISDLAVVGSLTTEFASIPTLYVADGHHRSAAAAIVGRERKGANPRHRGDEGYNFFLAVAFPAGQLRILDYNRLVKDLNRMSEQEFIELIRKHFRSEPAGEPVRPSKKGEFGLYVKGQWYRLSDAASRPVDPTEQVDVAILQRTILAPILGIADPRVDKRIDFVGGIRGLEELERRVNSGEMKAAFSVFPTSIDELMQIADSGSVMPPKSTWFEPKLLDGLFVHFLDEGNSERTLTTSNRNP